MNPSRATEIPAALPVGDFDELREKLIRDAASADALNDPDEFAERTDVEDEEAENAGPGARPTKKKLLAVFAALAVGFAGLAALVAWFFGLGYFAPAVKQNLDRTAKTSETERSAPVSEDEKLKMALNLVAERSPTDASIAPSDLPANSALPVPPTSLPVTEPLLLDVPVTEAESPPDETRVNEIPSSTSTPRGNRSNETSPTTAGDGLATLTPVPEPSPNEIRGDGKVNGRSLFFGPERKELEKVADVSFNNKPPANLPSKIAQTPALPFGKLLPVRLLGALYTLRSAGGLVRMELTQEISADGFSYPAGTVVVGQLRGSEGARAFVSVVGLIDGRTGALVKFGGEVVGTDGASGVAGRRRGGKSAWSRIWKGIRETGASAIGAIGGRSGGTVVIAERSSGELRDEVSEIVGTNRKSGEFVEVAAGTSAFVLVTELPKEQSSQSFR